MSQWVSDKGTLTPIGKNCGKFLIGFEKSENSGYNITLMCIITYVLLCNSTHNPYYSC